MDGRQLGDQLCCAGDTALHHLRFVQTHSPPIQFQQRRYRFYEQGRGTLHPLHFARIDKIDFRSHRFVVGQYQIVFGQIAGAYPIGLLDAFIE